MIDPGQVRELVVEPVLRQLTLNSPAAVELLMGTAAVESEFRYIKQLGGGPALGLWQMEPATHDDCWSNFLDYREALAEGVASLRVVTTEGAGQMAWNLRYAAAMARIHYLRVSDPLPEADDLSGLAQYWKRYYNTQMGAGTVEKFIEKYRLVLST